PPLVGDRTMVRIGRDHKARRCAASGCRLDRKAASGGGLPGPDAGPRTRQKSGPDKRGIYHPRPAAPFPPPPSGRKLPYTGGRGRYAPFHSAASSTSRTGAGEGRWPPVGDRMGRQLTAVSFGAIARVGAVAVGCVALSHCSGSYSGKEYSPRVVEDGEPVPKGGGAYRVGKPYNINGRTYFPSENSSYRGEGVASWYGPDFHGRLTANGEVYDMHSLSAAHPTMPLPSYARVTNLDNGRSIIVRVNDRGPFAYGR